MRSNVRASWQDAAGRAKFTIARALDLSETGIRIELPEPVDQRSIISVQSDRIGLAASGTVRYCNRCGSKYLVGIEFGLVRLNRAAAGITESLLPVRIQDHSVLQQS